MVEVYKPLRSDITTRKMCYEISKRIFNALKNLVIVKSKYNKIDCKLPYSCQLINNGIGVFIHKDVKIGKRVKIWENVVLSYRNPKKFFDVPIIGDGVLIYSNALILGRVRVGRYSVIGAGSVVLKDVPESTKVLGLWK